VCRQSDGPGELAIHAVLARHFTVDRGCELGRVRRARGLVLILVIVVARRGARRARARHLSRTLALRALPGEASACARRNTLQHHRAPGVRATSRRATRQHAHSSSTARYPRQGAGESFHCPIHPPRGRRQSCSANLHPASSEWLRRRHRARSPARATWHELGCGPTA